MEDNTLCLPELGYQLANQLFQTDVTESTLYAALTAFWDALPLRESILQMSLFLLEDDGLYRELVHIQEGQLHIETYFLSERQLPQKLSTTQQPFVLQRGARSELWIPFGDQALVGFMIWVSPQPLTVLRPDTLLAFQQIVSLGIRHYATIRRVRSRLRTLQAVTDCARLIAGTEQAETILYNLVDTGVRILGFDRATLFVYGSDETTVLRTLFAGMGHAPRQLIFSPTPPIESRDPALLPHIHAVWLPLLIDGKRVAGLLLDNLYSQDTVPEGALQSVIDIGVQVELALQNASLLEVLNAKAIRDDLTGLYRVDFFYRAAGALLQEAGQHQRPCGLIMLDLDNFKQVNDTYGHPTGDALLVHTADVITNCLPPQAVAGRIGGDEFVICLPDAGVDQCCAIGQQLLDQFSTVDFLTFLPTQRRLTLSIGIASFPEDGVSITALIHAADQAMYTAKRRGKAQVSVRSAGDS